MLTTLMISGCSMVYELIISAVSSYLVGDSTLQYSVTIGLYMFALGIGSFLSKFVRQNLWSWFVNVEIAIGIVGGTKVDALSKSFSLTREEFSGFVDAAENLILMKRMKYALWDGVLQLNESLRATQKNMRNAQTQIA